MPKFNRPRYSRIFGTIERDTPSVSLYPSPPQTQNRLARLEREEYGSRSTTVREFLETADRLANDRQSGGQKVASRATALLEIQRRLGSFRETDFANPQARAAYRFLRAQEELQKLTRGNEQKVTPSGGNKKLYNPTGKAFASTLYGTTARLSGWASSAMMPRFMSASSVLPCIERVTRREVMFAKGKAGKGYHTKKRRTWSSGVPC